MELTAVDLFCGAGGLSAGLADSGIEVLAAYDSWETAICTYRRNLSDHAHLADLTDVENISKSILEMSPDLIAGGPPCQDFSTAGKRKEGDRANLTRAFGDIVGKCKPPFFLMENVPQVRLSLTWEETKAHLAQSGYNLSEVVVDASFCGVPQSRKRFFAFGVLGDSKTGKTADKFINSINSRLSDKKMTIKEYLRNDINVDFYYRHPRNYSRRAVFSVLEPSPTIRGVNRPVPPNYKGNHLDSAPPSTVRALTSWERSRIQTFPAMWDWEGSNRNSEVELQIGNAVPVGLASYVSQGVRDAATG